MSGQSRVTRHPRFTGTGPVFSVLSPFVPCFTLTERSEIGIKARALLTIILYVLFGQYAEPKCPRILSQKHHLKSEASEVEHNGVSVWCDQCCHGYLEKVIRY